MAMESNCHLQVGKERYDGKATLEADHIDFAGSTKFRFRLSEVTAARQDGSNVLFGFHGHTVTIDLGTEKTAVAWAEHVLHPRSLADKLGIKDGHTIRLMNIEDPTFIHSLQNKRARVVHNGEARCDLVMLGVERASELRQIENLCENLRPDGAIWVVLPKSVRTVTKANVFAAAREAGLTHVEVVDFSDTQSAHKIMRPAHARGKSAAKSR
jgi:hypothetical protein